MNIEKAKTIRKGFQVGDLVTRDGTDVHFIDSHNGCDIYEPDMLEVVCIIEPENKWIKVGEKESNLARRYQYLDQERNEYALSEAKKLLKRNAYKRIYSQSALRDKRKSIL